jgi:hypothetical protein
MNEEQAITFDPSHFINGERHKYRDVHWCSINNEPIIFRYEGSFEEGQRVAVCPDCGWKDPPDQEAFLMMHPFLFHIMKPPEWAFDPPYGENGHEEKRV